ncbi:hypothetical protein VTN02DRAFT_2113 [Thermoascus thermophilus]
MEPVVPSKSLKHSAGDGTLLYPKSSAQWQLVLQDVKSLYLRRQYRQCAMRSAELLNDKNRPLHLVYKTFLHFYSAISYEALGRAAHTYSSNKVPLLQLALDHLTACNASLPAATPVPSIVDEFDSPLPAPKTDENKLMPPPLHIRKPVPLANPRARARPLPPLPIKIVPARNMSGSSDESDLSRASSVNSRSISSNSVVSVTSVEDNNNNHNNHNDEASIDVTPNSARAISRYNSNLRSFSSHVRANIAVISSLISTTTELQHIHRATRDKRSASFWSFTPLETKRDDLGSTATVSSRSVSSPAAFQETKQERIARLRAEGWNIGLRAKNRGWKGKEYYDRLCSQALGDLYPDESYT